MKKILLGLVLLLEMIAYAQQPKKGDTIKFHKQVKVLNVESIYSGVSTENDLSYLETDVKFYVVDIDASGYGGLGSVLLRALNFTPLKKRKQKEILKQNKDHVWRSDEYNDKMYTISKDDFETYAYVYKMTVQDSDLISIGLLTLPFKSRPISDAGNDLRFDTEFNLSSTVSICFKKYRGIKFNYQLGGGIGTVGLDSSNSDGLPISENGESVVQDVATLTVHNGIMFEYSRVQIGFYAGVDYINNNRTFQWNHNGDIWLGFGIGVNVFQISFGNENANTTNTEQ